MTDLGLSYEELSCYLSLFCLYINNVCAAMQLEQVSSPGIRNIVYPVSADIIDLY